MMWTVWHFFFHIAYSEIKCTCACTHTYTHMLCHMDNCVCETYLSFNSDILSKHKWDSEMFCSSLLLIISSHTLAIPKISDVTGIQGDKWKITPELEHYIENLFLHVVFCLNKYTFLRNEIKNGHIYSFSSVLVNLNFEQETVKRT